MFVHRNKIVTYLNLLSAKFNIFDLTANNKKQKMNNNSKNTDFMNTVVLNQTLFKKFPIVGGGFSGGTKAIASTTASGYILWVNGLHNIPNPSEITQTIEIGTIQHPYLIAAMGDGGGEIKYWLGITEWEYLLLAGVKLNAFDQEFSEHAIDIATLIFKDRVPIPRAEHLENYSEIAGELLLAHFTVFLGKEGAQPFKDSIESELNKFLSSVLDYYIENAEELVDSISKD
jgi:hypothetical protein